MAKHKDALGLIDRSAKGLYLPWWAYEATKKCLYQYKLIRDRSWGVKKTKVSVELLKGCGLHIGMEHWTSGCTVRDCYALIRKEMWEVNDNQLSSRVLTAAFEEVLHYFAVARKLVSPLRVGQGFSECTVRQEYQGLILACRVDHVEVLDRDKKICIIWDYKASLKESSVKSMQLRYNAVCLFLAGWTVQKASFILPWVDLVKPIAWSEKLKERLLGNIVKDMRKLKSVDLTAKPSMWNCRFCNWGMSCEYSILQTDLTDLKEGKVEL